MMYDWWGYGAWAGWIAIVLTVVFLAAIIVGIVFLVRGMSGDSRGSQGQASPTARLGGDARDIVRRRYAAGEIDREEYEQKLRDLDG